MKKQPKLDVKNKVILGICAHPDDLDFGASGTVAKFVKEGAKFYYLLLTDGSKGSEDMKITPKQLVEIRHKEQRNAAKVLGLQDVFFLDFVDGELENTHKQRKPVVEIIRKLKPDIVMTTDPTFVYNEETGFINHPDHRNAGQIALDCVFPFARNSKTYPELIEESGLGPHIVKQVLLTNLAGSLHLSNYYVDITDTLESKLEAIKCHVSQYDEFESIKSRITKRSHQIGKKIGTKYAEGFILITLPN